jgi:hypothetical protein
LRLGLLAAAFSAPAKSCPPPLPFSESAGAALYAAGSLIAGALKAGIVAFIPGN